MLPETQQGSFTGKQLSQADTLSKEQYGDISTLIYETDPYIYPAMFACSGDAKAAAAKILPAVFELGNDTMFRKENLYVFLDRTEIIGLILWHTGHLHWSPELFFTTALNCGIHLNMDNLNAVSKGYVDNKYSEKSQEENISLINICVDRRMRGRGIGRLMMSDFLEEYPDNPMELCVLADNPGAIKLYEKMGFRIASKAPGFSLADDKPVCYDMVR